MSSCKLAFNTLAGRTGSIYSVLGDSVGYHTEKKRPFTHDAIVGSGVASSSSVVSGRPLHPRPPPIHQMVENISGPIGYRQQAPTVLEGQQQVKRKRGRPSKAETEAKAAEAAARGEIYYPQYRKAQKPVPASGALAPSPIAAGPSQRPPPTMSVASPGASVVHRDVSSEARPSSSSVHELVEKDVLMTEPGDRPASSSQATQGPREGSPREPALEAVRKSPKEMAARQFPEGTREESMESEEQQLHPQPRERSQERYRQQDQERSLDQRRDALSLRAPKSPRDRPATE